MHYVQWSYILKPETYALPCKLCVSVCGIIPIPALCVHHIRHSPSCKTTHPEDGYHMDPYAPSAPCPQYVKVSK